VKVWIDALTPKHVNLFSVFASRLTERGHVVSVTTREYREAEALLRIRGVPALVFGRHGGAGLASKLVESSRRVGLLAGWAALAAPDLVLSFCSPEAARVAYGLGIPHFVLSDSPHAESVCRLTLPLVDRLFTPRVVPRAAWRGYGISGKDIVRYDALDPVVWIRAYPHDPDPREALGLDASKPLVVLRTQEEQAAYLLGERSRAAEVARAVGALGGVELVVLPRYEEKVESLQAELGGVATVLSEVVDAVPLVARASVFIGAGGTMNAEAALLGVPTVSFYPSTPTYVDRYLFRAGLASRVLAPAKIAKFTKHVLDNKRIAARQRRRAARLVAGMEDPVEFVLRHLSL